MRILGFVRWGLALLALVAVGTDLVNGLRTGVDFTPGNFFSYFTIESNILAALVLVVSGFAAVRGSQSRELSGLRGASTLYLAITGVVYNFVLVDMIDTTAQLAWTNFVLHVIMPIALTLDFLVDRTVHRLGLRNALFWLGFPLVWTAYTLIRGAVVDWYPYPFLDAGEKGWGYVTLYIVGISAAFFVVGTVLAYSTRVLNRSAPTPLAPAASPALDA